MNATVQEKRMVEEKRKFISNKYLCINRKTNKNSLQKKLIKELILYDFFRRLYY